MRGNSDRVLIPVPKHVTHSGPEDGSECMLCKFYRDGYWTSVDSMLDHSRQEWLRGYNDGKDTGKRLAHHETEELIRFFATCVIVGLFIGLFLRIIVDKELAKQTDTPHG